MKNKDKIHMDNNIIVNTSNKLLVKTNDDINIYNSDISMVEQEYISTLNNPDMIYKSSSAFMGLLNSIYINKLQYINVLKENSKNEFDYDYSVLSNIFYRVYIHLCAKYNKTVTIIGFCNLVDINFDVVSDIYNGVRKASPAETSAVKKWYGKTKGASLGRAIDENSIGAIFNLKANYGMIENNAPQKVIVSAANTLPLDSLANLLPDPENDKP
jgi:hypothetical protein